MGGDGLGDDKPKESNPKDKALANLRDGGDDNGSKGRNKDACQMAP